MHRKHIRKTVETLGLKLIAIEPATGNGLHVDLQAPDSAVRRFMVSRLDDPHADVININQFKRFARDHQRTRQVDELELPDQPGNGLTTNVGVAVRAIGLRNDRQAIKTADDLAGNMPIARPMDHFIDTAIAHNAEEGDYDLPESLTMKDDMPKLTTVSAPASAPTTTPVPTTTEVKAGRATGETRLNHTEFYRLCALMQTTDTTQYATLVELAPVMSEKFGQRVSTHTIGTALEATGKKLARPRRATPGPSNAADLAILGRVLVGLLVKLNEPVPDDLRELAQR